MIWSNIQSLLINLMKGDSVTLFIIIMGHNYQWEQMIKNKRVFYIKRPF